MLKSGYHEFILQFVWILFLILLGAAQANAGARTVKIAMCQIFCLDGDRSGNFVRIENALAEAKEQGAQIVCFPETAILGWVNSDAHRRAHPIPGPDSDRLSALVKKYQVFLCIGLAEKNGKDLHDSAILINPAGEIILKHRKINILTELMTPPYTPGDEVKVVNTRLGKIGLLICADSFLETYRQKMAALEPDLVLIPYGWAAPEADWPAHLKDLENIVRKTAREVGAPVVGTDLVGEITKGPWTGQTYGGGSVAVDRLGRVLALAKDRDRDVKIFTVNLGE